MRILVWRRVTFASGITSLGIVASLGSIGLFASGDPRLALTAMFAALAADRFDGRIARALHQETAFGAQLDSLADALSFGVVPPVAAFFLTPANVAVMSAGMAFAVSALWRLADYNEAGLDVKQGRQYFRGIPTTDVAAWFLILTAGLVRIPQVAVFRPVAFFGYFVAGGFLMISGIPYPKNGRPTQALLVLVPLAVMLLWIG